MRHVIKDRVTERMTLEVEGGDVHIRREYQLGNGQWRVDPEAGVSFGAEHLDEFVRALAAMLPISKDVNR